jgi:hypothetical protein
MVYTDIQTLRGLDAPVDYGSGVEYANGLLGDLFENVGLQMGLWLNGTTGTQDIVNGNLDDKIQELMDYLNNNQSPHVFLRVGYEFDNPWFGYTDADSYVQAYRKLYKACQQYNVCREKTSFVWHSWAAPRLFALQDFYPGDDVVDWIGISLFQQVYPWRNDDSSEDDTSYTGGSLDHVRQVLSFAQVHDKPVMIAESTPYGGIDMTTITTNVTDLEDAWTRWFQPVLELIDEYDIAMWSYINCDWESQSMWHNVGFGNTRLAIDAKVMKQWRSRVLDSQRFLQAGSLSTYCDCGSITTTNTTTAGSEKRHHHHAHRGHYLSLWFHGPQVASAMSATTSQVGSSLSDTADKRESHTVLAACILTLVAVIVMIAWFRRRSSRRRVSFTEVQSVQMRLHRSYYGTVDDESAPLTLSI